MADVVRVLAYPPGTGKTQAVAEAALAAAMRGEHTAFFFPTVALAREVAGSMRPYARVILGRDQPDPLNEGQRMCQRADVARAVNDAGQSVGRTLCPECPYKAGCAYLRQFQSPPPILLYTHAHLTLPRRSGLTPLRAVVDEAFWQGCIDAFEFPFASFAKAWPPGSDPALWDALETGWQAGDVLARLRALPDAAARMEGAGRLAFQGIRHPKFDAKATVGEVRRRAGGQRHAVVCARILRSLAAEMIEAPERAISHIARLVGDMLHLSFLKELLALDGVAKVLVIDAQADPAIVERLMPGRTIVFERRDAIRNADIVQVSDSAFSNTRLKDNPKTGIVDRVARFAEWLETETAWSIHPDDPRHGTVQKTLLIAPKATRLTLTGEDPGQGTLPVSVPFGAIDVAHYGNLKGSNSFKDYHSVVLLGRSQLPPSAIEAYSGLFWRDPEPLQFAGEYVYEGRGYCNPSGLSVSVHVHPDLRFQSLLEQSREWECVQALDRLRLYGPVRKKVYLITNLPLPVHVSRFAVEKEVIPDWRDLAVQNGGLILDSPTWLAKTFLARFRATASVAKEWLAGGGWQSGGVVNRCLIGNSPTLPPQHGPAACAPDPLSPIVVQHRAKPTRAGRGSDFKDALSIGNPGDIPAKLDDANGKPTEFVIYLGGWGIMTNLPMPPPPIVREIERK